MTTASAEAEQNIAFMYAVHDAFRRDLGNLARAAGYGALRKDQYPALRSGWEVFGTQLHNHHSVEDAAFFPAMRAKAKSDEDQELMDAMEAEHAKIDPLIADLNSVMSAEEIDRHQMGDLADELHLQISGHLRHEEQDALPLASRVLTTEDWRAGATYARKKVGLRGASTMFPWLLSDASAERKKAVLSQFPAPLRFVYRRRWVPKYQQTRRWI